MISYPTLHIILGLLGVILVAKIELNQGLDFTIVDLILSMVVISFGPFILFVAILLWFGEPKTVLIKGRKK